MEQMRNRLYVSHLLTLAHDPEAPCRKKLEGSCGLIVPTSCHVANGCFLQSIDKITQLELNE